MTHTHNAFENEIFAAYREDQKKITDAIKLLEQKGYIVYNKNKTSRQNATNR